MGIISLRICKQPGPLLFLSGAAAIIFKSRADHVLSHLSCIPNRRSLVLNNRRCFGQGLSELQMGRFHRVARAGKG